jgi:predicted enzyme related to lactoylglutathione lyase
VADGAEEAEVLCYTTVMQKVTGIGGVFFKARDPEKLMAWYEEHLGIQFQHGYIEFTAPGSTVLSIKKEDTAEFEPSTKEFMLNFRVADLRSLLSELKEKGVTILGDIEEYDYGRFAHIVDPEGNKIDLWEPKENS